MIIDCSGGQEVSLGKELTLWTRGGSVMYEYRLFGPGGSTVVFTTLPLQDGDAKNIDVMPD